MTESYIGRHRSAPPAGWYPDVANRARARYWDGAAWTTDTALITELRQADAGSSSGRAPRSPSALPGVRQWA